MDSDLPFTSQRLHGEVSMERNLLILYSHPEDKSPGIQGFPVQNIRTLGAGQWGRMKDTGEAPWHSGNGSNVY